VGGSRDYVGAVALAGIAALRSGVDSFLAYCPEKVSFAVNALSSDIVTRKLKGEELSAAHFNKIKKSLSFADVLLTGNGISAGRGSDALIKKLLVSFSGPKVLDARALYVFDQNKLKNSILLPNPKEYEMMRKKYDLKNILKNGNIIIAKNYPTKIFFKNKVCTSVGNPGLTKSGTGDVLAGLVAGFLAQNSDPLQAAVNAVYFWHKTADILYKKKRGYFYLASDLATEVKSSKLKK
jgi:NAD(P)H-hydrate epimerase